MRSQCNRDLRKWFVYHVEINDLKDWATAAKNVHKWHRRIYNEAARVRGCTAKHWPPPPPPPQPVQPTLQARGCCGERSQERELSPLVTACEEINTKIMVENGALCPLIGIGEHTELTAPALSCWRLASVRARPPPIRLSRSLSFCNPSRALQSCLRLPVKLTRLGLLYDPFCYRGYAQLPLCIILELCVVFHVRFLLVIPRVCCFPTRHPF